MARVKRGIVSKRKHNKLFDLTQGYRGPRRKKVKSATEALLHAGAYAYHGRKLRKRNFRTLWITRISNAVSQQDLSYSKFIAGLKKAKIEIDRKILADIVLHDAATFKTLVDNIKKA